jgi:hypothetical protein
MNVFASSTDICQTEIAPIAIGIEESTKADPKQQNDLQAGEHTGESTTHTHRGAVDECRDDDCAQRNYF